MTNLTEEQHAELFDALVRLCHSTGTATGETYKHLHRAVASIEVDEPDEYDDDINVCDWCGEEIGIIHYGDGDRWQPTPALGDDLCEVRAELANGDGVYRHEPADYRNRV